MSAGRRTLTVLVSTTLLAGAVAVLPTPAGASPPESGPGSLDTTFGTNGRVQYGSGFGEALDTAIVQDDGKIVAAFTGQGSGVYVYRLHPDGGLDSSWAGEAGAFYWPAGPATGDPAGGLTQDGQGRTYVTSGFSTDSGGEVAVLRLDGNGEPDPGWGGDGEVRVDVGGRPGDRGTDVAVDPVTGRVYVAVSHRPAEQSDFGLLAFDESGALDVSFDREVTSVDGLASVGIRDGDDVAHDVVVMPDGDVVVVGVTQDAVAGSDVALWRLRSDGSAAAGFGEGGVSVLDVGRDAGARSAVPGPGGSLFVSLARESATPLSGVAKVTASGDLDATFGRGGANSGGLVRTDGDVLGYSAGITTDRRDRVVVVGESGAPTVARLVDDRYAEDTTLNAQGSLTLDCPVGGEGPGGAQGVAVDPEGRILVVGTCPEAVSPYNGNVPTFWRLDGGDEVPLPEVPQHGDGVGTQTVSAGAIDVGGTGGRSTTVQPGAQVDLSFAWDFTGDPDGCTGACITQVIAGFVNNGPEACVNAGTTEGSGRAGSFEASFTAPSEPGRYYLAMHRVWKNSCGPAEVGGTFLGDGKAWYFRAPTPTAYLAEVIVSGTESVVLTADQTTVEPGQRVVPVKDIPLDALTGALGDLQSTPLRASPLRASPLRASPLRASPLRASPLRASPLRASPLRASPLRASPIPLSQVPLDGAGWAEVLTGTVYENKPLQNVTLQEVLDLEPAPPAVLALTLDDIDVSRTALRNVSLTAFLLGNTPVSALGVAAPGGDAGRSLLELELAGVDLSSVYEAGVTVTGKTLTDAPLSSIRLGDMWLDQTPFGSVATSTVPGDWVSCAATDCPTLADVQAADVDAGLTDKATIGALLATGTPQVTVGQLLPGLVAREQLGYERLGTDVISRSAPLPDSGVRYTLHFAVGCTGSEAGLQVEVDLPPGFRTIPGQERISVPGLEVPTPDATGRNDVLLSTTLPACEGSYDGTARVVAEPGLLLGPAVATGAVTLAGSRTPADAPVTVVVEDSGEPTPVPRNEAGEARSTVFLGHVSAPGEQDTYTLPTPAPGSQVTVRLGHVPAGQDFDLSVFGPGVPDLRSSPLRASPLRASPLRASAVTDASLEPSTDGTTAPPEAQPDVPVQPPGGSTVLGVSANRGDADESVTYRVPEGGGGGPMTVVVSGYNGSADPASVYSLLVSVTPGPDAPECVPSQIPTGGTRGAAVSAPLPPDTQTLVLTNRKRLEAQYGATATDALMGKLAGLTARGDVKGAVVPVEADDAVHAAYAAWDQDPCSVAGANAVVAAINDYVDTLRSGLTDLRYIVLVGGDLVVPMARVQDRMALENEASYANDQVYDDKDNALSASLRAGYVLSDDPYGDFNPIPWLDAQAFVPDVALGRLVETPAEISKAVDEYVASSGRRSPTTAYTAGYDFNADGAQEVADTLAARVPAGNARSTINGTWTRSDAIAELTRAATGYASVNAHYDAHRALPANEDSGGTGNQLLTTADLPANLTGGVLFTIGCHAGLSVADTFVANPSAAVQARLADWVQTVSKRGGVYAANTGYGYGDTVAVAYSERLMADFAKHLDGSMTVGQALMFAKQSHVTLPLSVVDVKVMVQATFYGLPMYRLGAAGTAAPSVLPSTPASGSSAAEGELVSADFASGGRELVRRDTGRGSFFAVQNGAAVDEPLAIPGRPLQPQTTDVHDRRGDGKVAHGVLLESLTTRVTSGSGGFDPVYSSAAPDSSTTTPEPSTVGSFFPTSMIGVVERATPQGPKDVVVLTPGQFRSASSTTGLGWQQLADSMGYRLLYSDKDDVVPPAIETVRGTVQHSVATFTVSTPDADAQRAVVLYLVRSSTTPQSWERLELDRTGNTFTGTVSVGESVEEVEQFFVQLVDDANNVSVSSKKGQDFSALPAPTTPNAPVVTVDGTKADGSYVGPQRVVIQADAPVSYTLDGSNDEQYTGPFTVSGTGTHEIVATAGGESTTVAFTIAEPPGPSVSIASPSSTRAYVAGGVIPAVFTCTGFQVTSCAASPSQPVTTEGTHTFTVTATDQLGKSSSASVTYAVGKSPFGGFQQPINVTGAMSIFKKGSTIPVKFRLLERDGTPIADSTASALAAGCGAVLSHQKLSSALPSGSTEESVSSPADVGGCFRYDPADDQFHYNLKTKPLAAPSTYQLTVSFPTGFTASQSVKVGLR